MGCDEMRWSEMNSSVLVRIRRQELEINRRRRDFRRLLTGPLQHHFRLLDHSSEECLSLLRPLLKILFFAREFLRTTEALHINETRSVIPNLRCGKVVDRLYCICESRFCSNLSSESEQLLLKLRRYLLHRHRHRYSSE